MSDFARYAAELSEIVSNKVPVSVKSAARLYESEVAVLSHSQLKSLVEQKSAVREARLPASTHADRDADAKQH